MKKILITGGTVFVSRYAAQYFVDKGYEVYVVNRNSRPQVPGVKLIETDRHDLGDKLKDIYFDVVADITAYNAEDITDLCDSLGSFGQYIMQCIQSMEISHSVKIQNGHSTDTGGHMVRIRLLRRMHYLTE